MDTIDYEKLLPDKPAADVVGFACQAGAFNRNYLVYKSDRAYNPLEDRTEDAVLVACSHCGHRFHADKIRAGGECGHGGISAAAPFGWFNPLTKEDVINGGETVCPLCHAGAETVHIGSMRLYGGELVDDAWVSELIRIPVDGLQDRLALLDWCVRRCVSKEGKIRWEVWPYTAWVVEETRIVRLMGYQKTMSGVISLFGHWKQRKKFVDTYGVVNLMIPWDPALLAGTTAENCKLDLYQAAGGKRLVSYLALWRRRPAVENLLVQGCGNLVVKWIKEEASSGYYDSATAPSRGRAEFNRAQALDVPAHDLAGGVPKLEKVNWKEKRPARMLGLNKEEFRELLRAGWSADDLENYKMVRDAGLPARLPADMELLRGMKPYVCNQILAEAPREEFWRTVRYLQKQKQDWSILRDYRRMAAEDGRDMAEFLVRWPRDLHAAHNRQIEERRILRERQEAENRARIAKIREKERAEREPLFRKRAEELAGLSYSAGGLLIRPCASEAELIAEGRALHHCVATYARSHAAGKTAILFIRRAADPDKPYFTLEFDEKARTVKQNRGMRNCDRTPEVTAFETQWLEFVKSKKKARVRVA